MIATTTVQNWGSSLGVVIPKELVRYEHLSEGEEVVIDIRKRQSVRDLFGSLPDWKINSQKMKNELRKEWAH